MPNMLKHIASWGAIFTLAVLALLAGDNPGAVLSTPTGSGAADLLPALLLMGTIGKFSDMVIYQEEFQTGLVERVTQFLAAFNEQSRGAIQLVPRALKGHYSKAAFFKDVAGLVSRRDITSTAAANILPMTQDEVISVKLNRKIGPVGQTLDAMKKAGLTEADASRAFGAMAGERKMKDMLNSAMLAVESAIAGVSGLTEDVSGASPTNTATTHGLRGALSKFGDASQDVVCWIAHSKPHFDIIGQLMAQNVTGLTDIVTIQGAVPAYLGRPVVVTDSPALVDLNGSAPDTYNTLGLVANAVVVEESEDETFFTDVIGGAENLYRLFQSEYAFNVTVRGHKWDTTNGGINPTDVALGTSGNWDKVAYDNRLTAGVRLLSR
jgi:hypothetical protein